MHIHAALTDHSTKATAPVSIKGSKDSGDFESAFLDSGETTLSSKDAPILEEVVTEEVASGKVEADPKTASAENPAADLPEHDDLEPLSAGVSKPSTDEAKRAEIPVQNAQRQPQGHAQVEGASDIPPQGIAPTKPGAQIDPLQNKPPLADGQDQKTTHAGMERAVPNTHLNAAIPQAVTQTSRTAGAIPIERLITGQIEGEFFVASRSHSPSPVAAEVQVAATVSAKASAINMPNPSADVMAATQARQTDTRPREVFHDPRSVPDTVIHRTAIAIPNPGLPQAPLVLPSVAKQATMAKIDTLSAIQSEGLPDDTSPFATAGRMDASQTQTAVQTAVLQHPQLPQHIARQMAEAMQKRSDGPVDVALSPEELGRVRMRISMQDGGIIINILAERAETLELMRKHADQLGQEFEDMGFGSVSFGFAASGEDAQSAADQKSNSSNGFTEDHSGTSEPADAALPSPQTPVTQGVDIRL